MDVHVRRVRVALGTAASLIETVHGVGYKLKGGGQSRSRAVNVRRPRRRPGAGDIFPMHVGHVGAISSCSTISMENESGRAAVDAHRVAVVVRELSFDLLRAMEAAVPAALAEVAGDLGPERLRRIANRVFAETKTRYGVNAVATVMAVDCGEMR